MPICEARLRQIASRAAIQTHRLAPRRTVGSYSLSRSGQAQSGSALQTLRYPLHDVFAHERVSSARDLRHDLPHLHGLAGRHLLNADDDLVIGCARGSLE
jgi:hypothetical protein